MKKIGVVLSGCGYLDGSEITESVLTLLHIAKCGAQAVCLAPDMLQLHVINHLTGQPEEGQRRVLVEAARIARGKVVALTGQEAATLDGLIFPGGFGAAKNLSNLAITEDDTSLTVLPEVKQLVQAMYRAQRPMGFICISPACVAAIALRGEGVSLTIGDDAKTAATIEDLGCQHVTQTQDGVVIDESHKIISTPAYMYPDNLVQIEAGIAKLVQEVVKRA